MKTTILVLLTCTLFACGGSVDIPDPGPEVHHIQVPDAPTIPLIADEITMYWTTPSCVGDVVPLGMTARGQTPTYASDGISVWPIDGRYDGAIYLKFEGGCVPGGPYEGYDFFTLGPQL